MPPRVIRSRFARFLLSGAANTLATYFLYLLLLRFMPYGISYTAAFTTGIALAYVLNRYFVFQGRRSLMRSMLFPLAYLAQYLLGLVIVHAWVKLAGWDARLAPLASIAISVPVTFVLTRWIFVGGRRSAPPDQGA